MCEHGKSCISMLDMCRAMHCFLHVTHIIMIIGWCQNLCFYIHICHVNIIYLETFTWVLEPSWNFETLLIRTISVCQSVLSGIVAWNLEIVAISGDLFTMKTNSHLVLAYVSTSESILQNEYEVGERMITRKRLFVNQYYTGLGPLLESNKPYSCLVTMRTTWLQWDSCSPVGDQWTRKCSLIAMRLQLGRAWECLMLMLDKKKSDVVVHVRTVLIKRGRGGSCCGWGCALLVPRAGTCGGRCYQPLVLLALFRDDPWMVFVKDLRALGRFLSAGWLTVNLWAPWLVYPINILQDTCLICNHGQLRFMELVAMSPVVQSVKEQTCLAFAGLKY